MSCCSLGVTDSVGQWAAQSPATARTLANLGLDICCGGKRPLETACREAGLDAAEVAGKVRAAHAARTAAEPDPARMELGELADHIVATHHAFLRDTLPRLEVWIGKMVDAHGAEHPEFAELSRVFQGLKSEMESHMRKEELILFPMAAAIGRGEVVPMDVAMPIACMEDEHADAGLALAKMRELTGGFKAPAHACTTWRSAYGALAELEEDMHRHVHKENNVLFPRALAAQAKKAA